MSPPETRHEIGSGLVDLTVTYPFCETSGFCSNDIDSVVAVCAAVFGGGDDGGAGHDCHARPIKLRRCGRASTLRAPRYELRRTSSNTSKVSSVAQLDYPARTCKFDKYSSGRRQLERHHVTCAVVKFVSGHRAKKAARTAAIRRPSSADSARDVWPDRWRVMPPRTRR